MRNSTKGCKAFLACRNNKCVDAYIGSRCEKSDDCYSYNPFRGGVRCVEKRCVKPRFVGFGCSHNDHCWSGRCEGGRCAGQVPGGLCDPAKLVTCEKEFYCSTESGKCEPQKLEFMDCNDYKESRLPDWDVPEGSNYHVMCLGGLKCSGPVGRKKCISWRQGGKGASCNYERDRSAACRFGLSCNSRTNVCEDYYADYPDYPCINSPRNCSYIKEESCICQGRGQATCLVTLGFNKCNSAVAANAYRDCMAQYNCAFEPDILLAWELNVLDRETCTGRYCSNIVQQTSCCAMDGFGDLKYSAANIGPLSCGSNPGLAIFLVLLFMCIGFVLVVGIIVIIIAGVFIYLKKKNSYVNLTDSYNNDNFQNIDGNN